MRLFFVALLATAFIPFSASALGDPPPERRVEFEKDIVEVDRLEPPTKPEEVLGERQLPSLVQPRLTFVTELIRSADDI